MSEKKIVLAFSGGLDTSFCVPWLIEKGYEVVTAFVDTGGVSDEERIYIKERAQQLGARPAVRPPGGRARSRQRIGFAAAPQTRQAQLPSLLTSTPLLLFTYQIAPMATTTAAPINSSMLGSPLSNIYN